MERFKDTNEKMFGNIGGKVKTMAKVCTWLGMIISVIYGIVLAVNGAFFMGIWMAVSLALGFWLAAIPLYGFGELIERNQSMDRSNQEIISLLKEANTPASQNSEEAKPAETTSSHEVMGWTCLSCGNHNPPSRTTCFVCGNKKDQ